MEKHNPAQLRANDDSAGVWILGVLAAGFIFFVFWLALVCSKPKGGIVSNQENYRVTKISVDPPTHHDYTTLAAALSANVPAIESSPLDVFVLEWTAALPSTDEYVVVYGCEAYGPPLPAPAMIRWFTESPEGENHTAQTFWDDVVSYIEGIDSEYHS